MCGTGCGKVFFFHFQYRTQGFFVLGSEMSTSAVFGAKNIPKPVVLDLDGLAQSPQNNPRLVLRPEIPNSLFTV